MPPSATPSADNYEDDQELAVVVDHMIADGSHQLVQEQVPHADTTVSESDSHHNLHHAVLEDAYSADSAGPSDAVEVAEAEQSWGFDMDEVIGGEDIVSAALDNPSFSEAAQEPYQHEEAHVVSSTVDNTHNQVEQESFVESTNEATEGAIEDIDAAVIADETERADQESDDEHDSEVREVRACFVHEEIEVIASNENNHFANPSLSPTSFRSCLLLNIPQSPFQRRARAPKFRHSQPTLELTLEAQFLSMTASLITLMLLLLRTSL